MDHSENFPFFQQNKNVIKKHLTKNKSHYSEDEDYFRQNQQHFNTNQQINNWNFDQPDPIYQPELFEPFTRVEQTRQTRQFFPQNKTRHHIIKIFSHKIL